MPMALRKRPYICGPLTELPKNKQLSIKMFYLCLGIICGKVTGQRAFIPHEYYDPMRHAKFTPKQVDRAERKQLSKRTSLLIVVALAPSWGGGIEVEIANRSRVPVIILCERRKLGHGKISRLLRGNPAVKRILTYRTRGEAYTALEHELERIQQRKKKKTS